MNFLKHEKCDFFPINWFIINSNHNNYEIEPSIVMYIYNIVFMYIFEIKYYYKLLELILVVN